MPLYAIEGIAPELPVGRQYWIAPTAVLIGRVRLLKNASVWFGAVLRGDNDWITVGENSNVQDNSVIHTDPGQPTTIGPNVTIGHNVILHSTTVGDNSLIGMGSTLLNGPRVGRNCLLGANTLVAEGKDIPDNSLAFGAPVRVLRQLTEGEIAMIAMSAQVYVENQHRFRENLGPVKGSGG